MGKTSQNYSLHVPESGHPTSGISGLRCGDIIEVSDTLFGQIQSVSANSPHSGKPVEQHRFREFTQSGVEISVPEEISEQMYDIRDNCCMIGVQRRCNGGLSEVHHYGWLSLGQVSLSNPTSNGPGSRPGVPLRTFSGVFGLYQKYTDEGPGFHFESGLNPIHVEYCAAPGCSPCYSSRLECGTLIGLFEDENGEGFMRISFDSGKTWAGFAVGGFPVIPRDETAFHCFQGSIIVGIDEGDGNPNVLIDPNPLEFDISQQTFELATVGASSTITPVVTHIVSSGHMIYAAWVSSDGEYGLDRSMDGGRTWDLVLEPGVPGPIIDVAARGSNVAFIVHGGNFSQLFLITDNGNRASSLQESVVPSSFVVDDPGVPLSAVALAIPDFTKPSCPLIYLASDTSSIYIGTKDGDDWDRIFQDESFCPESTTAHLETSIDGFGIWFSRAMLSKGKIITLKNVGRGSCQDWILFENSLERHCLDCGGEIMVNSCIDEGSPNRFIVELDSPATPGQIVICFGDGSVIDGYVEPGLGGLFILTVFSDDIITCGVMDGVRGINCLFCSGYPCRSWHNSAFAICPSNPDTGFVLGGASCPPPPDDQNEIIVIVKDIDEQGNPTQLVVCDDDFCPPTIGCD